MDENDKLIQGKLYVQNPDGTWSEICEVKDVNIIDTLEIIKGDN